MLFPGGRFSNQRRKEGYITDQTYFTKFQASNMKFSPLQISTFSVLKKQNSVCQKKSPLDLYRGDLFLATENGFLCHFGNLSPFFFKICLKFSQTLDFAQLSGLGLILIQFLRSAMKTIFGKKIRPYVSKTSQNKKNYKKRLATDRGVRLRPR